MDDIQLSSEFEERVRAAMDVPNPNPEFVKKLHTELVRGPVRLKPAFMFKPAWAVAFVLALVVFTFSVPAISAALGRIFGYLPDVGLVENTGNLRILAEPASLMRDGVTLIVKNVIIHEDRVELIYEVEGIAPFNDGTQAEDANTNPTAFCGGVNIGDSPNADGDARLRLPDSTILERDYTGLYPQNVFAMKPVYKANVPSDVLEMTLLLKCIPWARLGAVPENWEVPIKLMSVPAETIVGEPVIEVQQPTETPPATSVVSSPLAEEPQVSTPVVKMTLEKIVPIESAYIFYFSMDMENKDPSLISIMPVSVSVIDSQGQKIQLIGNYTWQPFEHRAGSLFEFTSASKPADGPLTVMVENAVAYYAPLYVEPRQATPEEMSFTFDAGTNPQQGQTWKLNSKFTIAGYPLRITSARAVIWDEVQDPSYIGGSQGYDFGYQFAVETDPSVKIGLWMDIRSKSSVCWLTAGVPHIPSSWSLLYTQLCRERYPNGLVNVTIGELAVLLENTWQSTWKP